MEKQGGSIMSAITISIINNKGGVGKTSSTAILAELMAFLGLRVLCIDLDEQSNLSMLFKCYEEDNQKVIEGIEVPVQQNISDLFKYRFRDKEQIEAIVQKTAIENLYVIPSSKRHKNTLTYIAANETGNNNTILRKALNTIKDEFDFILIDNAPASNVLTVNSIFASDYILTPVRAEGFSYKGLKETIETIAYIKEEHDIENANFLGTYITQVETNTKIFKELKESYSEELGVKFLGTPIRKDIKVAEMETIFQSLLSYAPNTNAIFDYALLLLELNILPQEKAQMLKAAIGQTTPEAC